MPGSTYASGGHGRRGCASTKRARALNYLAFALGVAALASCGDASEAPRVQLPVTVDATGITSVTNDLGYAIELASVRIAINDIVFTVAGEVHSASV